MAGKRFAGRRLLSATLAVALVLNLAVVFVPLGRVAAAAVAPLLVLYDPASANPFGTYLQEILNAEGVKDYEVRPLADLDGALLTGRRAVLLGEATPNAAHIAALDNFVSGGGGLIAMRPVAGLDPILGVTQQTGTTSEGYLRITDPTLGAGLYADTMQFHGTAGHYALAGATEVARLYTDRATATSYPAVTLHTYGAGKAALFAYDLARSVVLTRQGNPANANVDADGDGVFRTIDLFFGWIDLERTSVPQADLQQRLLVRLLEGALAQPLPRLWYFPKAAPTVHVATADAHANPDSYYQTEIDALEQHGATGTFYLSPASSPSTANVEGWRARGFDFGPHPNVDCGYECGFDNALSWLNTTYGITARTARTHQVRWSGWADAAAVEARKGIAMDFNFYQWGPWLTASDGRALGYLTGGGQPLRFADAAGTILPVYQQHTALVDEELAPGIGLAGLTLDQALAASRKVIDASVGGYHTPIATQYHVDYFYPDVSTWGLGTVDYALQQGALSLHSDSWLTFVQQRAATTIANTSWASNTLSFDVSAGGPDQTLLIPVQFGGNVLSSLRINGTSTTYGTMVVNGTSFAVVATATGSYAAAYSPDTTAPTVTGQDPAPDATGVPTTTPIRVTFSEAMDRTATQAAFSLTPSVAGAFSWDSTGTTMAFTPASALGGSTTYTAALSTGARDLAGNPLAGAASWSFTTAAVTPPPAVTGVSPVSGSINGGTAVTIGGSAFTGATTVTFGGTAAAGFTVVSDTAITAVTPAHAVGTVDVLVSTPAGTSAPDPAARFTFVDLSSALALTAADPATGAAGGGTSVTLTGANFATGATVTFGGVAATSVTVTSTTAITAIAPAHAAGVVDIVVTNPDGRSVTLTGGYTYVTCPTGCLMQTTVADFRKGTLGAGTYLAQTADGEVLLAPAVGAEFAGTTLPAGWSNGSWASDGSAAVSGGVLTVDGALVATDAYYSAGRSIEFVATFAPAARYQHAGLGVDLNSTPWAIFSTGGGGDALYARTNAGGGVTDTLLSGNWLGTPHRYRIDWTATGVTYSIDGTQVASHALAITGDMRPVLSDGATGDGALAVDWLRLSPYAAGGTFTSAVLDAGSKKATWDTIAWTSELPAGTGLTVSVRMGNTPTPNGSWTAFTPVTNGVTIGGSGRYLQYRVDLSTTDPDRAPALHDLTVGYSTGAASADTGPGLRGDPSTLVTMSMGATSSARSRSRRG